MKQKKSVLIILMIFLAIFAVSVIQAEETEEEKSYTCLKEQLGDNCGDSNNVEQISFNLLAMAYDSSVQSDCESSLLDKKNEDCWGETESSVCRVKSSAIAILALDQGASADVEDYIEWLLSQRKEGTGLTWFLEIDANNKTECTVNGGSSFTIDENRKLSGSTPAGLIKSYNNYWFEIKDTSKNYTVICDEDFVTSLLYKKPGSSVYYVSSKTNSAAAHDSVTEKVESFCFSLSSSCDYESSLWAALALAKADEDISSYLPYLSAYYDESSNAKYLPAAFLYILTGADDYYTALINQQKSGNYWDESRNRIYDTSLALLALQGVGTEEIDNAKKYLLNQRNDNGCWNSYTSLILYSGWPKIPASASSDTTISQCTDFGHYCVSIGECDSPLSNFYCPSLSESCCEDMPDEKTCEEKGGQICEEGYECTSSEVTAEDTTSCCLASCIESEEDGDNCESLGYLCQEECSSSQEEKVVYTADCDFGMVCCGDKQGEKSFSWLLILLLIILILLVIVAIIFRNQLKIWWFKTKSRFKSDKGPVSSSRPSSPPPFAMPPRMRPGTQRVPLSSRRPMVSRPSVDRDFEETMRKLKEMSK